MKKMEEQKPIYEDIESIPSYSNDDFFDILDKNENANKVRTEDDLYNNYRESIKDSYIFEKRKKENVDNLYLLYLEDKNLLENIEILKNLKKKLSVKEKNFMT